MSVLVEAFMISQHVRRIAALLSLVLGLASQADAQVSAVDLRPLLRVSSTLIITDSVFPPPSDTLEDQDVLITRGGAVLSETATRFDHGEFFTRLVRGVASQAGLGELQTVLAAARIGVQEDCEIDNGGSFRQDSEITWYGRRGRRNSFRVFIGDGEGSALPPCSAEVRGLLQVLGELESEVINDPDSEVLFSDRP